MPQLQPNKLLGALRFQSKGMRLPMDYMTVTPAERSEYVGALPQEDRNAVPRLIPQWFKPELPIAPHQLMCDHVGQGFKDLHDTLCDAVAYGHNMWRLQAKFSALPIAGPSVIGPPGCLLGPPLASLIKQYPACSSMTPIQEPYKEAVALGVSAAFLAWQSAVVIPGLPLFPAYSMQPPGPAIPTPAIPQKLIAFVSTNVASLMVPTIMKELMIGFFDPTAKSDNPNYEAFFDAISTVLALAFINWLSNQMVIGLVGSGAVGSPLGGPVAGVTLPTAGHLAT
ncbi:MAG: hypothetical protein ABI321_15295 [Polyangia bacterium]